MNRREDRESLLDQLLEDDEFRAFNAGVKSKASQVLRRRQILRRVRPLAAVALVLIAVTATKVSDMTHPRPNSVELVLTEAPPVTNEAADHSLMSDEELLSLLPSNSCFFAELDGVKVLIFKDAEARARLFEEGIVVYSY